MEFSIIILFSSAALMAAAGFFFIYMPVRRTVRTDRAPVREEAVQDTSTRDDGDHAPEPDGTDTVPVSMLEAELEMQEDGVPVPEAADGAAVPDGGDGNGDTPSEGVKERPLQMYVD